MKKVLIILTILLLLSACSKSSDIESCRYNVINRSYAYASETDGCAVIYKKIESVKSKSVIDTDNMLGGNLIIIHFEFVDSTIENYFLNSDGTLLYNLEDVKYSTNIGKELFTELIDVLNNMK